MALHDFTVAGGETKTLDIVWTLVDGETSTPYDLSSCSARMQFRRGPGQTVIISLTSDDDEITLEPDDTAGLIRVTITPEQTLALAAGGVAYGSGMKHLMHDLFVEFDTGEVRQVIYGQVEVIPPITLVEDVTP